MKTNRLKLNLQILDILKKLIEEHPELRFKQLLYILNIINDKSDTYAEESSLTLNKINNLISKKTIEKDLDTLKVKEPTNFDIICSGKKKDDIDEFFKNYKFDEFFKNYKFDENVYNEDEKKVEEKISLNEFNNIIKDNSEKLIVNHFYDNYEYDDRSTIINTVYRYLWRQLIVYDINIVNIINDIFKSIPKYEMSDDYLYNIHMFIISKLFNTYIKIKYNNELKLNESLYDNCIEFKFKEITNFSYHGSHKDDTIYKLTYKTTLDDIIKKFENLKNDIKFLIQNNLLSNNNVELYNTKDIDNILILKNIYEQEVNKLMHEYI